MPDRKASEVEKALRDAELNSEMASEIFREIAELLSSRPCYHGQHSGENTPPMMYPEWIACVVKKAEQQVAHVANCA